MNERIKLIRKHNNLSQAAFGMQLGVSRDVINNIEQGRNKTPISELMISHIIHTYNVNPEWLRNGTGDMFLKADAEITNTLIREHNLSPAATDFVKNFLSLPHNKQEILIEVLSEIVK